MRNLDDQLKELLFGTEQKKAVSICVAVFILATIYANYLILPRYHAHLRYRKEGEILSEKIDDVNKQIRLLDGRIKKMKELSKQYSEYSKGLSDQKEIPEFLEELASIARVSGVKILSITPSNVNMANIMDKTNGYYYPVPIVTTANSGYHQLGHFISSLEQSNRYVTIDTLHIKYNVKFPWRHDVTLISKTYVANDSTEEQNQ